MVRRWLPWIVLGVLVVGVLAYTAWPRGVDESTAARTHRIASELRCVDCESLSVADSATSTAAATRADIAARIRHGESDAEIRQVYVDRYGESVLLKPSSNGLGRAGVGAPDRRARDRRRRHRARAAPVAAPAPAGRASEADDESSSREERARS